MPSKEIALTDVRVVASNPSDSKTDTDTSNTAPRRGATD